MAGWLCQLNGNTRVRLCLQHSVLDARTKQREADAATGTKASKPWRSMHCSISNFYTL